MKRIETYRRPQDDAAHKSIKLKLDCKAFEMNSSSSICDFSLLRNTAEGKKAIVKQFMEEGLSVRGFCAKYNIPPASLCRWKKSVIQSTNGGVDKLHSRAGRPSKIDQEKQSELIDKLKLHLQTNSANARKRDLRAICEEMAVQTAKKRNIDTNRVELSAKTIKKYVVVAKTLIQEEQFYLSSPSSVDGSFSFESVDDDESAECGSLVDDSCWQDEF